MASEILHAVTSDDDSFELREGLVSEDCTHPRVQLLPGHTEPDVLRGALISVATLR
jgi:hypothetical protein